MPFYLSSLYGSCERKEFEQKIAGASSTPTGGSSDFLFQIGPLFFYSTVLSKGLPTTSNMDQSDDDKGPKETTATPQDGQHSGMMRVVVQGACLSLGCSADRSTLVPTDGNGCATSRDGATNGKN